MGLNGDPHLQRLLTHGYTLGSYAHGMYVASYLVYIVRSFLLQSTSTAVIASQFSLSPKIFNKKNFYSFFEVELSSFRRREKTRLKKERRRENWNDSIVRQKSMVFVINFTNLFVYRRRWQRSVVHKRIIGTNFD